MPPATPVPVSPPRSSTDEVLIIGPGADILNASGKEFPFNANADQSYLVISEENNLLYLKGRLVKNATSNYFNSAKSIQSMILYVADGYRIQSFTISSIEIEAFVNAFQASPKTMHYMVLPNSVAEIGKTYQLTLSFLNNTSKKYDSFQLEEFVALTAPDAPTVTHTALSQTSINLKIILAAYTGGSDIENLQVEYYNPVTNLLVSNNYELIDSNLTYQASDKSYTIKIEGLQNMINYPYSVGAVNSVGISNLATGTFEPTDTPFASTINSVTSEGGNMLIQFTPSSTTWVSDPKSVGAMLTFTGAQNIGTFITYIKYNSNDTFTNSLTLPTGPGFAVPEVNSGSYTVAIPQNLFTANVVYTLIMKMINFNGAGNSSSSFPDIYVQKAPGALTASRVEYKPNSAVYELAYSVTYNHAYSIVKETSSAADKTAEANSVATFLATKYAQDFVSTSGALAAKHTAGSNAFAWFNKDAINAEIIPDYTGSDSDLGRLKAFVSDLNSKTIVDTLALNDILEAFPNTYQSSAYSAIMEDIKDHIRNPTNLRDAETKAKEKADTSAIQTLIFNKIRDESGVETLIDEIESTLAAATPSINVTDLFKSTNLTQILSPPATDWTVVQGDGNQEKSVVRDTDFDIDYMKPLLFDLAYTNYISTNPTTVKTRTQFYSPLSTYLNTSVPGLNLNNTSAADLITKLAAIDRTGLSTEVRTAITVMNEALKLSNTGRLNAIGESININRAGDIKMTIADFLPGSKIKVGVSASVTTSGSTAFGPQTYWDVLVIDANLKPQFNNSKLLLQSGSTGDLLLDLPAAKITYGHKYVSTSIEIFRAPSSGDFSEATSQKLLTIPDFVQNTDIFGVPEHQEKISLAAWGFTNPALGNYYNVTIHHKFENSEDLSMISIVKISPDNTLNDNVLLTKDPSPLTINSISANIITSQDSFASLTLSTSRITALVLGGNLLSKVEVTAFPAANLPNNYTLNDVNLYISNGASTGTIKIELSPFDHEDANIVAGTSKLNYVDPLTKLQVKLPISGLDFNKTYVVATQIFATSGKKSTISYSTGQTGIGAVQSYLNPKIRLSGGALVASWTFPSNTGGAPITTSTVILKDSNGFDISTKTISGTGTSVSFLVADGIIKGNVYSISVSGTNGIFPSAAVTSTPVTYATPITIASLTVEPNGSLKVNKSLNGGVALNAIVFYEGVNGDGIFVNGVYTVPPAQLSAMGPGNNVLTIAATNFPNVTLKSVLMVGTDNLGSVYYRTLEDASYPLNG